LNPPRILLKIFKGMFDLFFLLVILLALGVICFVIFKKFPQIVNLDLENLSEEKTTQKKREIIANRMDERGREIKEGWKKRMIPLMRVWGKVQLKFRIYVGKIERLFRHEQTIKDKEEQKVLTTTEKEKKLDELLRTADDSFKTEAYDKAEELYISVIKMDSKMTTAYRGLAETYLVKGDTEEAMQTFGFLSQLTPNDDNLFMRLGEVYEEQGNLEKAIQCYQQASMINSSISSRFYHLAELLLRVKQAEMSLSAIKQAVDLEPKNPRYLDLLIESAIICDEKGMARAGYENLRLVNPENHKLEEYKERLGKMS